LQSDDKHELKTFNLIFIKMIRLHLLMFNAIELLPTGVAHPHDDRVDGDEKARRGLLPVTDASA
jgi:hypothetical protein